MTKLLSVIVPVYNVEKYLPQCLDSIIAQTFSDTEIIIVDDGSTERSPTICDAYAAKDNRISVIHKPNAGLGAAYNTGINAANGKYIGFVESDDFIASNMFEKLLDIAVKNDLDVARCNFFEHYKNKNIPHNENLINNIETDKVFRARDNFGVFQQMPSLWVNLYKKDFLNKNNIRFLETPGASYQDASFVFKVYAVAERFMLIEDNLLYYRRDNENASVKSKNKVFCVCDEFAEIERFIREKGLYEELKFIKNRVKYHTYMWNLNRIDVSFKPEFLNVFCKEFQSALDNGEIDRQLFGKKNYENLLFMLQDKSKFLEAIMNKKSKSFMRKLYSKIDMPTQTIYRLLGIKISIKKK